MDAQTNFPHHNAALDDIDRETLAERVAQRDAIEGPRPGDWIVMADGPARRFTDRGFHVTAGDGGEFYLGSTGAAAYVGRRDMIGTETEAGQVRAPMKQRQEARPGSFWFLRHDKPGADNRLVVELPCRVFVHGDAIEDDPTGLISSSVVAGFNKVEVARGLKWPCCGFPLRPQAFTCTDATAEAVCPRCHITILHLELDVEIAEERDDFDDGDGE